MRTIDGTTEVALETWAALARRDLLSEHTAASMLAGVSTRGYATVLEPDGRRGDQFDITLGGESPVHHRAGRS